jgi:hypothetical protein
MNFIGRGYISKKTCKAIIKYFEDSPLLQNPGKLLYNSQTPEVREEIKKSTDIYVDDTTDFPVLEFYAEIGKILEDYKEEFIYSDLGQQPWSMSCWNIQRYLPGEGFYKFHSEHMGLSDRHLAFTVYLNDVEEGGETEFYYQQEKIRPEEGLVVIFPVAWTHTHRGIVAPKETKYIATGWYVYR